ncbi:MAG: energy coupling factor transporter S component ThiW [Thermoprotei archaeon]|mgnify:CR=1 FL=1|nr:MAG: energy coupling factor transporter S component ThiW [Thermoprotei archaeon]
MGEVKAKAKILKAVLSALFTGLAVVLAPWLWFPVLGSKAYPGQHLVNAVAGVLLGPWWASLVAMVTGVIRMSWGIGTIYSMPGGIPGALVVGLMYDALKKSRWKRYARFAALTEPIGTVIIGGTLALFLVAPAIGDVKTMAKPLLALWSGWSLSSVPGSILGFIIVEALERMSITREQLFGE